MKKAFLVDTDTDLSGSTSSEYTDKRGYAARWMLSVRTVDNLMRDGLPHLAVGRRRTRICIPEADQWMHERYGRQRLSAIRPNVSQTRSNTDHTGRHDTAKGSRSKRVGKGGRQ